MLRLHIGTIARLGHESLLVQLPFLSKLEHNQMYTKLLMHISYNIIRLICRGCRVDKISLNKFTNHLTSCLFVESLFNLNRATMRIVKPLYNKHVTVWQLGSMHLPLAIVIDAL